ncbi:MAG: DUF4097 family beta strand repeat-containing protein [Bacilli bacterium]|jgi:hypothetical protein|nr:DUF4097 family beta strand repeat-containing protein [Bacilli bacterium]
MTKDEYLNALKGELKNQGIEGADEIAKKYESRFELAKEAGFSEEEAIEKFGQPKAIVDALKAEQDKAKAEMSIEEKNGNDFKDTKKPWTFIFSLVADNVEFSYGNVDKPYVDFNGADPDNYRITQDAHFFKLEFIPLAKFIANMHAYTLKIILPSGEDIDSFRISNASANVNIPYIKSKEFNYSVVSGKLTTDDVRAATLKISNVSGHLFLKSVTADEMKISTVSGDTDIDYAEIKKLRLSTVTGNVKIASGHVETNSVTALYGKIIINGESHK